MVTKGVKTNQFTLLIIIKLCETQLNFNVNWNDAIYTNTWESDRDI